jgi:hypothetical protein
MLMGKFGCTAPYCPRPVCVRAKPAAVRAAHGYTVAAFLAGCIVGLRLWEQGIKLSDSGSLDIFSLLKSRDAVELIFSIGLQPMDHKHYF